MTDEQLRALKAEFDELIATRENLTTTQERCKQLLEENRRLHRELQSTGFALSKMVTLVGELEEKLRDSGRAEKMHEEAGRA